MEQEKNEIEEAKEKKYSFPKGLLILIIVLLVLVVGLTVALLLLK